MINVGSGIGTTVKEFVAAFRSASGLEIRTRETGPRPGDLAGGFTRSTPPAIYSDGSRNSRLRTVSATPPAGLPSVRIGSPALHYQGLVGPRRRSAQQRWV